MMAWYCYNAILAYPCLSIECVFLCTCMSVCFFVCVCQCVSVRVCFCIHMYPTDLVLLFWGLRDEHPLQLQVKPLYTAPQSGCQTAQGGLRGRLHGGIHHSNQNFICLYMAMYGYAVCVRLWYSYNFRSGKMDLCLVQYMIT